jgi:hypothetical protein
VNIVNYLSALPALLGVTVFVAYIIVLKNQSGDRVTVDIVSKLRRDDATTLPANVDAATLSKLIETDAAVRSRVNQQDFALLKTALRQQYITSIFVYAVPGALFVFGITLYVYTSSRPQPLSIAGISTHSSAPAAGGLAVDSDPLEVSWAASGRPEDLAVSLQNITTGEQSEPKRARPADGRVTFQPSDYERLLADGANRDHGGANSVRASVQGSKDAFFSGPITLHVGTIIDVVRLSSTRIKIMAVDRQFCNPVL